MKNQESIKFSNHFGPYCINGSESLAFLGTHLMPLVETKTHLVLDFDGIRVINSSFSNALFGGLFQKYGQQALDFITIVNASPLVKSEIKSGINHGLKLFGAAAAA